MWAGSYRLHNVEVVISWHTFGSLTDLKSKNILLSKNHDTAKVRRPALAGRTCQMPIAGCGRTFQSSQAQQHRTSEGDEPLAW